MYTKFSIKTTYNTFSYQDINTHNYPQNQKNTNNYNSNKTKINTPSKLVSPLLSIIAEKSNNPLNNDNSVVTVHKENIAYLVDKNTQCRCVSTNILQLLENVDSYNIHEIIRKIALFFIINDMVNYYYTTQQDISFKQLNDTDNLMRKIYDNYSNITIKHNTVTCDLANIVLQGKHSSHDSVVDSAYFLFNDSLLGENGSDDSCLLNGVFNIKNILGNITFIPVGLKISSIVDFLNAEHFLLSPIRGFCRKTMLVKDGYVIDYDLFYGVEYYEFISIIVEINNMYKILSNMFPVFSQDYIHMSNQVDYVFNTIENPRILAEPLTLLYLLIIYDMSNSDGVLNEGEISTIVTSFNGLLEKKDSISIDSLRKSVYYYMDCSIPLDMVFSIVN